MSSEYLRFFGSILKLAGKGEAPISNEQAHANSKTLLNTTLPLGIMGMGAGGLSSVGGRAVGSTSLKSIGDHLGAASAGIGLSGLASALGSRYSRTRGGAGDKELEAKIDKSDISDMSMMPGITSSKTLLHPNTLLGLASTAATAAGTHRLFRGNKADLLTASLLGGGLLGSYDAGAGLIGKGKLRKGVAKTGADISLSSLQDELHKIGSFGESVAKAVRKYEDPIELAGLGVLAAPQIDNMVAKYRARKAGLADRHGEIKEHDLDKFRLIKEKYHAPIDVGGLAVLAAPSLANMRLGHH